MSLNLSKSFKISSDSMSVEACNENNKQYNIINDYSMESDEEEAGPNTFEGAVDEKAEAQGGGDDSEGGGFDKSVPDTGDSDGGFGDESGGDDSSGGEGGFDQAQDENEESDDSESKSDDKNKLKISANPLAEINGRKLLSENFSDLYNRMDQTITKFQNSELSKTVEFKMLSDLLVMAEGYKNTFLLTNNEEGQLRYRMIQKQFLNILEGLKKKVNINNKKMN